MRVSVRIVDRAVACGALLLVVVLGLQVRELRTDAVALRERVRVVSTGDVLPPFEATSTDGVSVSVAHGRANTLQVLLVFNTRCGFCAKNLPYWRGLVDSLRAAPSTSVLGWSHDPDSLTVPYVAEHGLTFPVITPDSRWRSVFKVGRVPTTLVVGEGGRVRFARAGVLTREAMDSVMSLVRGD
ncbi:MAG: redoxin domain-containing protein [Gemmatimonadales bacterium]